MFSSHASHRLFKLTNWYDRTDHGLKRLSRACSIRAAPSHIRTSSSHSLSGCLGKPRDIWLSLRRMKVQIATETETDFPTPLIDQVLFILSIYISRRILFTLQLFVDFRFFARRQYFVGSQPTTHLSYVLRSPIRLVFCSGLSEFDEVKHH